MTDDAHITITEDSRLEAIVDIERYADQGRCVAHIDGRVVFVRFALSGEKVKIRVDEPHERKDRFWTGEVIEVLEANEHRIDPVWPLAGPLAWGGGVGGADLIHVDLEGQLEWKRAIINEQMKRLGYIDVDVPVHRLPADAAAQGLGWRTRVDFVADESGHLSMRRRESHERVRLTEMPLASSQAQAIADHFDLWNTPFEPGAKIHISAPEPRSGQPDDLESGNYAVTVNGELVHGLQRVDERIELNDGRIFDYGVDAQGFWQVNRNAPQTLAQHVFDIVERLMSSGHTRHGGSVIWDLYSGSGLFTIPIAQRFEKTTRVVSIEGAATAVKNARNNIRRAHIGNVVALKGDVMKTLRTLEPEYKHPEIVVLDPPRAGAGRKVSQQIIGSRANRVIYVACDPTSLARDTATFIEGGYKIEDIQAYDIYPMTHHVETVCLMSRVEGK